MEMEKSYYVVAFRPAYLELLREQAEDEEPVLQRLVVSITQGGFGQDVVDDERQVKERFLEYLFTTNGMDLPRSAEIFDRYFALETVDEVVDLDEEI